MEVRRFKKSIAIRLEPAFSMTAYNLNMMGPMFTFGQRLSSALSFFLDPQLFLGWMFIVVFKLQLWMVNYVVHCKL